MVATRAALAALMIAGLVGLSAFGGERARFLDPNLGNMVAGSQATATADRQVQERQAELRFDGLPPAARPAGPAGPDGKQKNAEEADLTVTANVQDYGLWVQPYATWGDIDEDNDAGVEYDAYGVLVGLDRDFGPWLAGLSLGYTDTDVNPDDGDRDNDVETIHVGAYGSARWDRYFFDMSLGYSCHDHTTERETTLGGVPVTATAGFDGDEWTLRLGGGAQYSRGDWDYSPEVAFISSWYEQESYEERGAGANNLDVADYDRESYVSYLGGRVGYTFNEDVRGELRGYWLHEFGDVERNVNASFQGGRGTFTGDEGIEMARNGALLGASLQGRLAETVTSHLTYEAELRDDFSAHQISLGIRCEF
jgi:outer membrane autotransporter protein